MNFNLIIVALIVLALAVLLLPSLRRPYLLICLFAVASPITWTMGDPSTTIVGRFAVADLVGLAFLCVAFAHAALSGARLRLSPQVTAAAWMIVLLMLGLFVTRQVPQTMTEILVLCFLAAIFLGAENVPIEETELKTILKVWIIATVIVCLIGLWDCLHYVIGTPQLIQRTELQEIAVTAIATFRNTGQAGAYVMLVLFVALAYWVARGGFRWSKWWMPLAMTVMVLFLVLTIKRAAIIGTAIGVLCWATVMLVRQPRHMGILLLWGLLLTGGLAYFLNSQQITERFLFKRQTFVRTIDAEESGFMYSNWTSALESFRENPLLGKGYGGSDYVTEGHEVHSTYLKMLGEGGALGFVGYMLFMGATLWYFRRSNFSGSVWQRFLANLVPLLIGALVSWMNTYHLRKREFWIMLLVIAVAARLATRAEQKSSENSTEGENLQPA